MFDEEAVARWIAAAPPGAAALLSMARLDLSRIDPEQLSVDGNLSVNEALERIRAGLDAWQTRSLARLAARPDPVPGAAAGAPGARVQDPVELARMSVTADLAGALRWSHDYAAARMDEATKLVTQLPATVAALAGGRVSLRHAQALAHATIGLPPTVIGKIEKTVLERAPGQTVAQFRRSVRAAVVAADPRDAEQKHQAERELRRVCYQPADHAMAWINAYLPAPDAQAVLTAVQAMADRLKTHAGPGDPRSADQYRADALVAICQATLDGHTLDRLPVDRLPQWQGRRPHIQVVVALSTLLGLDQQPGELTGYGPIPAQLARRLAADPTGTWRRLVTDPTGQLLDYGTTRYRPPQHLIDHITTRDRTCRGPGCHRPAHRCDIDHLHPRCRDGHTTPANLTAQCRRHHHLKDDAGWTVHRHPDGTLTWTSPTHRHYTTTPDNYPTDTTLTNTLTDTTATPPAPDEQQDQPPPF
jgi:hypothetical protein